MIGKRESGSVFSGIVFLLIFFVLLGLTVAVLFIMAGWFRLVMTGHMDNYQYWQRVAYDLSHLGDPDGIRRIRYFVEDVLK